LWGGGGKRRAGRKAGTSRHGFASTRARAHRSHYMHVQCQSSAKRSGPPHARTRCSDAQPLRPDGLLHQDRCEEACVDLHVDPPDLPTLPTQCPTRLARRGNAPGPAPRADQRDRLFPRCRCPPTPAVFHGHLASWLGRLPRQPVEKGSCPDACPGSRGSVASCAARTGVGRRKNVGRAHVVPPFFVRSKQELLGHHVEQRRPASRRPRALKNGQRSAIGRVLATAC
jgi:hypothetical protein